MRSRLTSWLFWGGWLVLITAPFVWIKLDYSFATRQTTATFHDQRARWFIEHIPHFLAAGAILAAVGGVAWLARSTSWRAPLVGALAKRTKTGATSAPLRAAAVAGLVLVPLFTFSDKYLDMAIFTGLYVVLALGLNLTVGMTGLLVLGYAAFYGIGAYTFAIIQRDLGWPIWAAFVPAAGIGAGFGFLLGLPSLRLRGDYLAIVTLGFGEAIRYLLKNLQGLTGGDFGIIIQREQKITALGPLAREQVTWLTVIGLVILSVIVIHRLNHSRLGRAWIAIREDETAAATMGINTVRLKILAFTLSAVWAALAGVCYAGYTGFVDPESFRFEESALILSMVVLGGMGSGSGAILGAVVLYIVPRLLRDQFPAFTDYRLMIFGATMVVMMIFRPQGLLGSARRKIELQQETA